MTTDVTAAYEIKSLLRGMTIQGRVANLLNEETPFFDSAAGYNAGLASLFPRSFDVTLRARF